MLVKVVDDNEQCCDAFHYNITYLALNLDLWFMHRELDGPTKGYSGPFENLLK